MPWVGTGWHRGVWPGCHLCPSPAGKRRREEPRSLRQAEQTSPLLRDHPAAAGHRPPEPGHCRGLSHPPWSCSHLDRLPEGHAAGDTLQVTPAPYPRCKVTPAQLGVDPAQHGMFLLLLSIPAHPETSTQVTLVTMSPKGQPEPRPFSPVE